jgi:hypothetical protein
MSVVLPDPGAALHVPLLVGLACSEAIEELSASTARSGSLRVGIEWPNDLVVGDRKLGGILCEAVPGAVVARPTGIFTVPIKFSTLPANPGACSVVQGSRRWGRESGRPMRSQRRSRVFSEMREPPLNLGGRSSGLGSRRCFSSSAEEPFSNRSK